MKHNFKGRKNKREARLSFRVCSPPLTSGLLPLQVSVAQRHLRQRDGQRGPDPPAHLLPSPDAGPDGLLRRGGSQPGPVSGQRPPHGAQPADPRGSEPGADLQAPRHHAQHRTVRLRDCGLCPHRPPQPNPQYPIPPPPPNTELSSG